PDTEVTVKPANELPGNKPTKNAETPGGERGKEQKEDRLLLTFSETCVELEFQPGHDADSCFAYYRKKNYVPQNGKENKGDYKREVKRFCYDELCALTGKELPWGNLTGIRPTKLLLSMLREEPDMYSEEAKQKVMEKVYRIHRVGHEKALLGIDIGLRESKILSQIDFQNGYSVYIGIPFCPSTCLYCSFPSFPIIKYQKRVQEYLAAVRKELFYTKEQMKDKILDTVYIGGGTPSSLSAEELDILLHDITTILPWENVKEFTVEAGRADSITREKLKVLRKYPVTRISVNPQTMKEETLKVIGRHHTVQQVKDTFAMAREIGFDNINMDMILGLPGETVSDVENTLDEIARLAPDSLTVHSLAIKRASKMREYIDLHGGFNTMDYEIAMNLSNRAAAQMGMKPYYLYRQKNMAGNLENTGFALPGKYGIYNILIMEEVQTIVAIGAGTVTKRVFPDGRIERCDNVKDVNLYIDKIDEMIARKRQLFANENF
ncbi:MAG: coproporphyrinogen dehydrogenase HemZ, partial [Lachnospiraceae bacterium]